jgi:hypothetical protein
MRRRALLRATATVGALGALGPAGATAETTAQSAFEPLGSVGIPKAKEVVVDAAGAYAYVATTVGFAVVDLADPASPEVVFEQPDIGADREDGPVQQIFDVKLDTENDLLVATGAAQGRGNLDGFAVFDISDPTAPSRVVFRETATFNHNCDIDDGVVYLSSIDTQADRNALVAYDARTGERLSDWSIADVDERWEDVWVLLWNLHDIRVRDGVAQLAFWDAGTWLVDVSDPTAPELVARVRGRPVGTFLDLASDEESREYQEAPGNDHYAASDETGDLLGISVEAWDANDDGEGGPGSVHLYDVSDPPNPTKVSELLPPTTDDPSYSNRGNWTTSHNFEFRDGLAYTSWYNGGVRLHDISDPSTPRLLGAWRSENTSFWSAQAATEEFFVATSRQDPTVSNPRQGAALLTFPVVSEQVGTPGGTVTPSPTPSSTPPPTESPVRTDAPGATAPGETAPLSPPTRTSTDPPATDTATASRSPTGTEPSNEPTPDGSSGDGTGFGLLATLAGLGLGAARYVRRRERD